MYKTQKKSFTLLTFITLFGFSAMAQDVIVLKNGDEIKSLVQEIGTEYIKYKKFDNQAGPIYNVAITQIFMIKYENGTKDVFNEAPKPPEPKSEQPKPTYQEELAKPDDKNTETVLLPENMQSRKDVIVQVGNIGFQTKITNIDSKYLFYIKFKKSGKEKDKKIKQKQVAYTLSFNEKAKQGSYPLRMSLQEFTSLPVYRGLYNTWAVFGTDNMSNLAHVRKNYPDIYDDFTKGKKLATTGASLTMVSLIFCPFGGIFNPLYWAFLIPGSIIGGNGTKKINNAMTTYYANCVNLDILDKYGIVITPYKVNPLMGQVR